MNSKRQILLGAFFLATLSILAYYTLFLTDFSLFEEQHELVVHFEQAGGLRTGDSVLVAGIRRGRVKTLSYDDRMEDRQRRVTITLLMDERVTLREGFEIAIVDATVLGGKQVTIDPGPAAAPEVDLARVQLLGSVSGGPLAALNDLVGDNRERLSGILDNIEGITASLRAGEGLLGRALKDPALADDVSRGVQGFGDTMENARALSADLRAGKGTLGRLLTEEDLYEKAREISAGLETVLAEISGVTAQIREGEGTLARLVNDPQMAEDLATALASVRDIAGKINAGEGTLGRLVYDETVVRDIEAITAGLKSGEGTLGKLLTDEQVYAKLDSVLTNLEDATLALREGRGVIGSLLVDEELAQEVRRALELITLSLEEYREAAPVTGFTSVLFGAM